MTRSGSLPLNGRYAAAEVVPAVDGIRLAAVAAGIRAGAAAGPDVGLFEVAAGSVVTALFTRNAFAAAPVTVCRRHLADGGSVRALLVNSGNANAAMGDAGMEDALASCRAVATALDVDAASVLPFSTGVIGERLPAEKIVAVLPWLVDNLSAEAWPHVARAIMTTDTRPKLASRQIELGGRVVTINGMAKGAGMIRPDMATLLVFLATDAGLERAVADAALRAAVDASFNAISIDTDTSTNDSVVLVASGRAGALAEADHGPFAEALRNLCVELARGVVTDGEGVTRLLEVRVHGAETVEAARRVAFGIAESPLVKTAMHAGDANWGRIVMAIGKSDVRLDSANVQVWLGVPGAGRQVRIVAAGSRDAEYTEQAGSAVMAADEIVVHVDLGAGEAEATVWGADLSGEYVRINAEYRT